MGAHTVTGGYLPHGVNEGNTVLIKAVTTEALANNEVLTVQLPDGVDFDCVPVAMICYALSGDTLTRDADIGVITDHDKKTGKTRITASGAVASGSLVYLVYAPR